MVAKWAWRLIRPRLAQWIVERGGRLPALKVGLWAARLRTSDEMVRELNESIVQSLVGELERFAP